MQDQTTLLPAGLSQEKRELLEMLLDKEKASRFRLSFAQKRLWFLDKLEPDRSFYNVTSILRIEGRLDIQVLERSLNEVVRRHEVLRTTFADEGGVPMQVVAPWLTLPLGITDLRTASEKEQEALNLTKEEACTRFDLAHGPLLRVRIFRLEDEVQLLALVIHHIISDGWSVGVLVREMTTLYQAYLETRPSPLPDLSIQYADYAEWEEQAIQGDRLREQLDYWRAQLAGAPTILELPVDHSRSRLLHRRAARHFTIVGPDLYARIRTVMLEEGVTMFIVLLSAFQIVLARHSGQRDVVVGTPVANRNRVEVEPLIGFFVNMLVLRGRFSSGMTLREALQHVKQLAAEALRYSEVPLQKLVEELHPERHMNQMPLFQAAMTMERPSAGRFELPGLKISPVSFPAETLNYEFLLNAEDRGNDLMLVMEYLSEIYDEKTIEPIMKHICLVLEAMVKERNTRVWELPFVDREERRRMLGEWSGYEQAYPKERCLSELFEEQAARTPKAVAVQLAARSEAGRLTYDQLNQRANRLAHFLRKKGIRAEKRVGLLMERSLEMLVAILGVMKAGAAYVPLDPSYPAERLRYMASDSGLSLLLTHKCVQDSIAIEKLEHVVLDDETQWSKIEEENDSNPDYGVGGGNLAYVIYTSGSTGKPKGVMIAQEAILYRLWWTMEQFPMSGQDALLQKTAFSFDASVWEIFVPLLSGARLVMAKPGGQQDSAYLVETIEREGITVLQLVPSMLSVFLREKGVDRCARSLQRVFSGGEALGRELVERFRERLAGVKLQNLYGPTETSIDAASWSCDGGLDSEQAYMPLGHPLANARVYILSEELQLVPTGVTGEIYIGGAGLARGYHGQTKLTAERFVPHPYSGVGGERLYKTGDLGRHRIDGVLEYLGRKDQQVKVRGYRIELGEIEAELARQAPVKEAAVVAGEDRTGERRLVGYVVLHEGATTEVGTGKSLREQLRAVLPEYMVPAVIVELQQLPRTPNGKLDRQALHEPELVCRTAYVAPRAGSEEVLAQLWAEVLELEHIGAEDNFFELGGHSLLATQLMARIREMFAVELPLAMVFERPTLEGLAHSIDEALRGGGGIFQGAIQSRPAEEKKRLSYAQQRLWFLDQLETGAVAYSLSSGIRLEGELNIELLRRSLNDVVRRHESLRTCFVQNENGEPEQVVLAELNIDLPVQQVEGAGPAERQLHVKRLAELEEQKPFDLRNGPLVRAQLLRVSEQEHVALFTLHHIVSDGWSQGVLVQEIGELYAAYARGEAPVLEPLAIQYGDYAAWQREWLQGEVLEKHLEWWRGRLRGMSGVLDLPTDYPRPALQTFAGAHLGRRLPGELSQKLKELARRENVTLYMLLLAAFDVLLWRYSGTADIAVGTPIANRTRKETEGLIGFFVNTLVLRTEIDRGESFRGLLGRVREMTLGAYAHQDVPFERLVEELKPDRDLSRAPMFQVMFSLENLPRQELQLPGVKLSSVQAESTVSKFDLTLYMSESAGMLEGIMEFSTALFAPATIDRMWSHWEELLRGIIAAPQAPVAALPLLAQDERNQVIDEWNNTDRKYSLENSLVRLFEEEAEKSPEAIAVVFAGRKLTYRELNRRANQLAHVLRRRGMGPEQLAGIALERSLEMMVALLGVLKSGGAYVPMDPDYPASRLEYMLRDSGLRLVVTHSRLLEKLTPGAEVFCIDRDWREAEQESAENPVSLTRQENTAYVIYTSGSTGRPKGVAVTHGGLSNFLYSMSDSFARPAAPEQWVAVTSISFDISALELLWTLTRGDSVVLYPGMAKQGAPIELTPEDQLEWKGKNVQCTPSFAQALLPQWQAESSRPILGRLLVGGEAVPASLARELCKVARDGVSIMYGPTETTIWSTMHKVTGTSAQVLIGRPIGNTQVYLLDSEMVPAPIGVPGEIFIGGAGLARGYLGRPALTAERFVPDPFAKSGGGRLYRTGDRARYHSGGEIEFLGRIDHQIKIRGYRIELGEIESVTREHPGVREAAALVREDQPGDRRLVAYVTAHRGPDGGPALSVDLLKDHLRGRLPDYMVPGVIVELDQMPLTPNGKLDRRALPKPDAVHVKEYVAPRNDVEELLALIWSELLQVEEIGALDNFFDLGGHSLLATQMVSRIEQILRIRLPLRAIFTYGTLGALAQALSRHESQPGQLEKIARIAKSVLVVSEEEATEELRALNAGTDEAAAPAPSGRTGGSGAAPRT